MPERLEDAMRQYFDDEPEDRRLGDSHRGILQEVQRTPCIGVPDLALRLEISRAACGNLIAELISLGYLRASHRRDDRPDGELVLTDHGRAVFASPRVKALSRQFYRAG